MAEKKSEVSDDDQVSCPSNPSPSVPAPLLQLEASSFTYTPFYCEENVYFLCKKLCTLGVADPKGIDLFVVFVSNEEKQVPLWYQKASKRTDGLMIWDYHVICFQLKLRGHGKHDAYNLVWDLDSSLSFPSPLNRYFINAIRPTQSFISSFSRLFRVVHAPIFLRHFASDRSHMKDSLGNWISLPPVYDPIVAEDGTINNLDEYIGMHDADATTDTEGLIDTVFSNRFGVVLSEAMLVEFFSLLHG